MTEAYHSKSAIYLNDLGIVNALGCGCAEVLHHLLHGKSPGMVDGSLYLHGGKPTIVGRVDDRFLERSIKNVDEQSRVNHLLQCALDQLTPRLDGLIKQYGRHRIGVVIGTSTSGIGEGEQYMAALERGRSEPEIAATQSQYHYRNQEIGAPSLFVARQLDLHGPCLTVSTACSSSAKALATARNWLEMGLCDAVIAGGADSLCRLTVNGFDALGLVAPETCRPFQAERQGINVGESAALFVVSHQVGGARLLAVGESSDAYHISSPEPDGKGAVSAMQHALAQAGLEPHDLSYINLHGTATPANDRAESAAVWHLFADQVPCTSTKPLTGHTLGAAGATEVGFCWLLLQQRDITVPAQSGFTQRDPELPAIQILEAPRQLDRPARMLSNSFAFGGSNVSVIIESCDGGEAS